MIMCRLKKASEEICVSSSPEQLLFLPLSKRIYVSSPALMFYRDMVYFHTQTEHACLKIILLLISHVCFFKSTAGLTETCAGSFVAEPNELSMIGTVGPPLPVVDVCLESVPEMGYDALSATPRGEICIRGKCLFSGYYKREDLTNEVMIDEWFHTGTELLVFETFRITFFFPCFLISSWNRGYW